MNPTHSSARMAFKSELNQINRVQEERHVTIGCRKNQLDQQTDNSGFLALWMFSHHGNRGHDLVIFLVNRWVSKTMKAVISCLNNCEGKENKMVNNGLESAYCAHVLYVTVCYWSSSLKCSNKYQRWQLSEFTMKEVEGFRNAAGIVKLSCIAVPVFFVSL